jgi:hypothetical protein
MKEHKKTSPATELEEEIMGILLSSSLYVEMSTQDKKRLLHYLVTSYFNPLSGEKGRARPESIQSVPGKR